MVWSVEKVRRHWIEKALAEHRSSIGVGIGAVPCQQDGVGARADTGEFDAMRVGGHVACLPLLGWSGGDGGGG